MKQIFSFSLIWSLCLSLTLAQQAPKATPEAAGFSSERLARWTHFVDQEMTEERLGGAITMIYRKGQLAHFSTQGFQDKKQQVPMSKDGIFYIQSMTKAVVTTGLMLLYEEGHFNLYDPVSKYLPMFKDMKVLTYPEGKDGPSKLVPAKRDFTIAEAMTHTTGLLHGLGGDSLNRSYFMNLYMKRHQTIMDRVTALSNMALVDQPGESWHYSASPDILAALIEVFSGKNPAEFLEERLFAPLGMKDTGYNLEENQHDRLVEVFFPNPKDESGGFYQKTPLTGNTVYGGTHGLFSTASDYMNFLRMIENQGSFEGKRLLSRKTIELMSANHTRDIYLPGTGYGLGFAVRTNVGASKTLTSKGELYWSGLYCTYFMVDPEEDMIGILMTQTFPFNGNLGSQFKRMVYQAIAD